MFYILENDILFFLQFIKFFNKFFDIKNKITFVKIL